MVCDNCSVIKFSGKVMVMEHKQWKEILDAVNEKEDLSKDNVIERIKEKLKVEDKNEYEEWENADFSVNYLFQVTFGGAEKYTLLRLATQGGHTEIVKILIEKGAKVDAADKFGYTPLHWAIMYGHTEIVKILIEKEANVNARDKNGNTPLHCAAKAGHITEIVKILIENGADPLLKNNDGETPIDFDENGYITQFLREKALKKSVIYGGVTAVLGAAIAIALFATGTIAVELIPIVIAVVAVATAALAVGGITYMMSKPSTKVEEAEEEKTAKDGQVRT